MANQSIITIPSDLSDMSVLRSTLVKIVEGLDTALGNKGTFIAGRDAEVSRVKASAETVSKSLIDFADVTDLKLRELESSACSCSSAIEFTGTTVHRKLNANNFKKTATGTYTFECVPNSNYYSYFTTNKEVSVELTTTSLVTVRTYRQGVLHDYTDRVSVVGMYVRSN